MYSTPRKHGYRDGVSLDSNTLPAEALRGPNPELHSVNMDQLTTGRTRGNLDDMLGRLPEGTKQQLGMP